jgi:Sulfotransferase family
MRSRRGNNQPLPTFLGIGAPRTGTTWLHANLRKHPEVWLTPVKEVHYFDKRDLRRSDNRYYRNHLRKRSRRYRRLRTYRDAVGRGDSGFLRNLRWDVHFFGGRRNNDWYRGVFRPNAGQIAGEITPAYSMLKLDVVREIHGINPDLKVIYLMRDPIERSWSSALMSLSKRGGRPIDDITDDEIMRHFEGAGHTRRSDYLRTLDNWEGVFGRDQVFVGFLDEIQSEPADLLLRVYRFLGVAADESHIPAAVSAKVNTSPRQKSAIPERFRSHLAQMYLPQLEELSGRFGEPATGWLRRAEETLSSSHSV